MSKKTAEQATEVAIMSANTALSTMSGVSFGANIVSEGAETTIDSNGELAYVVTTKDKDGADVVISYTPTAENARKLAILSALKEAKALSDYMRCAYLADVADNETWRDMGYRSFSEFCENFAGLSGTTARQYARVGHWFLSVSDDGLTVDLRAEFLKLVPVSNLVQILSLVKKICDDNGYGDKDIESVLNVLYLEYVQAGKLHLRKGQKVCKDDMSAIMGGSKPAKEGKEGKDTKSDKSDKGKSEKAVPTLAEALAIIAEGLSDCDENVLSALEIVSKAVATKLAK